MVRSCEHFTKYMLFLHWHVLAVSKTRQDKTQTYQIELWKFSKFMHPCLQTCWKVFTLVKVYFRFFYSLRSVHIQRRQILMLPTNVKQCYQFSIRARNKNFFFLSFFPINGYCYAAKTFVHIFMQMSILIEYSNGMKDVNYILIIRVHFVRHHIWTSALCAYRFGVHSNFVMCEVVLLTYIVDIYENL